MTKVNCARIFVLLLALGLCQTGLVKLTAGHKQESTWRGYIETMMSQSKKSIDKGAILRRDGGEIYVQSDGLNLSDFEARFIAHAFKTRDFSSFIDHGLKINGEKYFYIKYYDGDNVNTPFLIAAHKDQGTLVIADSLSLVVLATCSLNHNTGNANNAANEIAHYFKSVGM